MTGDHILVGVDGSSPSLCAVDFAMNEGHLRHCPIRIVYVDPWASHPAWAHAPSAPPGELGTQPEEALRTALERAAAIEPEAKVTAEILAGEPGAVLVRESADAVLVVVGHRGAGGFAELLLGSVSAKLAAHAFSPVVVVRGSAPAAVDVVVGVDGSPDNNPAVGFAFAEADLRGVRLVAVHAATGPQFAGPSDALIYDQRTEEARATSLLYRAVEGWHHRYPGLVVHRVVRWAQPTRALIEAGKYARLIVVGRRGGGGFAGPRLGAVCHALLHHADCPVAVVPGDR
jgi:nucleotide-binding universal stress UspA family protein